MSVLLAERHKRIDKSGDALGTENGVQRMSRTESVPKRKRRVMSALRYVYLAVRTAISSIYIRLRVWLDEEMVERGVPAFLLLVRSLHKLRARKKRVPFGAALRADFVERLSPRLGLHIRQCTFFRNRRQGDTNFKLIQLRFIRSLR